MYCNHLEEAQKAVTRGNYAAKQSVKLKKLRNIFKDEDFKILQTHSTNEKIEVFVLPGNVYVVPSLAPPSHDNPLRFIHIRNQKCPLSTCKEKKSKLHTLTQKDNPLCIHTILTNYISGQAGTELGQAQLPTGIWFYCEMTRHLVLLYLLSRPTFQFTPF